MSHIILLLDHHQGYLTPRTHLLLTQLAQHQHDVWVHQPQGEWIETLEKQHAKSRFIRLPFASNDLKACADYWQIHGVQHHLIALASPWSNALFAYCAGAAQRGNLPIRKATLNNPPLSNKISGGLTLITGTDPYLLEGPSTVWTHTPPHFKYDTPALSHAKRVIGIGRGVHNLKTYEIIKDFAKQHQAAIGGTSYALERGWITPEQLIGQTGISISADSYLALGISGAPHHLCGIPKSTRILAMNNNPKAPILKRAEAFWQIDVAYGIDKMHAFFYDGTLETTVV